jgi:hypothetical protein
MSPPMPPEVERYTDGLCVMAGRRPQQMRTGNLFEPQRREGAEVQP